MFVFASLHSSSNKSPKGFNGSLNILLFVEVHNIENVTLALWPDWVGVRTFSSNYSYQHCNVQI